MAATDSGEGTIRAGEGTIRCGVYEAKTRLSELLELASAGREVVITRRGHDIVRLAPITRTRRREVGFDRGRVRIGDDFDAPLPEDMLEDLT